MHVTSSLFGIQLYSCYKINGAETLSHDLWGLPLQLSSKEYICQFRRHRDAGSDPGLGKAQEEMATHFSVLAWEIPWTEELGKLQSVRSQRVGHD